MKVVIVKAIQTSTGAPTQWDAWDAEDNQYYFRHRHGRGRAETQWTDDNGNDIVFGQFTGELEYSENPRTALESFCRQAGIELTPNAIVELKLHEEESNGEPIIRSMTGYDLYLLRKFGV